MKPTGVLVLALVCVVLLASVFFAAYRRTEGEIKRVGSGEAAVNQDPEIAAAVLRAQKSLDSFIDRLNNPREGDSGFGVNARFEADTGPEMLWVRVEHYDAEGFQGTVDSEPRLVNLKRGQGVVVKQEQVYDWIYFENGKRQGAFTTEVLEKRAGRE